MSFQLLGSLGSFIIISNAIIIKYILTKNNIVNNNENNIEIIEFEDLWSDLFVELYDDNNESLN